MSAWMDGWMDGLTDGRTEGWMDGWMCIEYDIYKTTDTFYSTSFRVDIHINIYLLYNIHNATTYSTVQ